MASNSHYSVMRALTKTLKDQILLKYLNTSPDPNLGLLLKNLKKDLGELEDLHLEESGGVIDTAFQSRMIQIREALGSFQMQVAITNADTHKKAQSQVMTQVLKAGIHVFAQGTLVGRRMAKKYKAKRSSSNHD